MPAPQSLHRGRTSASANRLKTLSPAGRPAGVVLLHAPCIASTFTCQPATMPAAKPKIVKKEQVSVRSTHAVAAHCSLFVQSWLLRPRRWQRCLQQAGCTSLSLCACLPAHLSVSALHQIQVLSCCSHRQWVVRAPRSTALQVAPQCCSRCWSGTDCTLCFCPQYDAKLRGYLQEYEKAFLVHADNVGSRQFMDIRAVRIWCSLNDFVCTSFSHFALFTQIPDAGTATLLAAAS